ncbi:MAG TPA: hypothetical protein VGO13_08720 [Solirubrobacterales bacterium]|nr:hypothetical protein [Solirubrobacterales bacterium]
MAKALVALVSATGCLAAVAYAATAPSAPDRGSAIQPAARSVEARRLVPSPRTGGAGLARPRIVRHPAPATLSTRVSFRYASPQVDVDFACKLDDAGWKRCARARVAYRGLAVGPHQFFVRAEAEGARSRPARFAWAQGQPQSFSIVAELSPLSRLYPGAPPIAVPLVLTNPNSAPIRVTSLKVSVTADPAACPSGANLELIQSSASERKPVKIPAGGTVRLPITGVSAPAIALRDLPVNQDACQGVSFPLAFSGEALG